MATKKAEQKSEKQITNRPRAYEMREVEALPYHDETLNLVVVERDRVIHTIRRAHNAMETLAELASRIEPTAITAMVLQDGERDSAPTDVLRERLIAFAEELAQRELDNPRIWSRHDWRELLDKAAIVLNAGYPARVGESIR